MEIDRAKWSRLTFLEQMGNISSEVGRAIIADQNHNLNRRDGAIERALDLFTATTQAVSGLRLREVLRARDEFLRLFYDNSPDYEQIQNYFNQFAIAARNGR